MAIFEIFCVEVQEAFSDHFHIVNVGLKKPTGPEITIRTVSQVRIDLEEGESFFVLGNISGRRAIVDLSQCSCGYPTIRSYQRDSQDDELQDIRPCR